MSFVHYLTEVNILPSLIKILPVVTKRRYGADTISRFIQASLRNFKDFSRTSKDYMYHTVFKDKKFRKNPDLSVKILLQKF